MGFEFNFTKEKLRQILTQSKDVDQWYDAMVEVLPNFDITSVKRVAAFIAQTAHESGGYTQLKENLNYSGDSLRRVWPKHFKEADVNIQKYHRNPEAIANRAYRNRMGNGDEASGDGWRYRGRGLIQLTGKTNYSLFADYAKMKLADVPAYVETKQGALHSAAWFWYRNRLNDVADKEAIKRMTKIINGGEIGLADRIKHYEHAKHVLSH